VRSLMGLLGTRMNRHNGRESLSQQTEKARFGSSWFRKATRTRDSALQLCKNYNIRRSARENAIPLSQNSLPST